MLTRFQAEQQTLALMDHPHIAQVFAPGMTDRGRPYFVRELDKGIPIVEYCNQQKALDFAAAGDFHLGLPSRTTRHTKGVIHTDLKPANVMVLRTMTGIIGIEVFDANKLGQFVNLHPAFYQRSNWTIRAHFTNARTLITSGWQISGVRVWENGRSPGTDRTFRPRLIFTRWRRGEANNFDVVRI